MLPVIYFIAESIAYSGKAVYSFLGNGGVICLQWNYLHYFW